MRLRIAVIGFEQRPVKVDGLLEAALVETDEREMVERYGVSRIEFERAFEPRGRFLQPAEFLQGLPRYTVQ